MHEAFKNKMKRHSYTCRRATNVGQSLPGCAGLMAKMFFHEVEQGIKSESEFDKTTCYFG